MQSRIFSTNTGIAKGHESLAPGAQTRCAHSVVGPRLRPLQPFCNMVEDGIAGLLDQCRAGSMPLLSVDLLELKLVLERSDLHSC